jgi:hypothetical protein
VVTANEVLLHARTAIKFILVPLERQSGATVCIYYFLLRFYTAGLQFWGDLILSAIYHASSYLEQMMQQVSAVGSKRMKDEFF